MATTKKSTETKESSPSSLARAMRRPPRETGGDRGRMEEQSYDPVVPVKFREIIYRLSPDILYASVGVHRSTIVERWITGLSSRTKVAQKHTSRRSSTLTIRTDSPDSALLIRHF